MKIPSQVRPIASMVTMAALVLGASTGFAQAPADPATQAAGGGARGGARGGGGRGAAAPGGLSAAQTASVGAIDTLLQARMQAVTSARAALTQAALTLPSNTADIGAKAQALAAAELGLSTARADAFSLFQSGPDRLTPAQIQVVITNAGTGGTLVAAAPAAGGGRGGAPGTSLPGGPQLSDPAYANFDFTPGKPVVAQRPEQQVKEFILQPGYKIENVLADPIIQQPTAIAFDGNGRMFVLEDRGYMLDADATNERDPIGRISLHEDVNNDGVYDKHTVFVDGLIFPRFVTPFGPNAILTMETDRDDVWKYTDTNNDGVADKKDFFASGLGRSGNVEHQQSFLIWTMDNWMYSTYNASRVRWTPGGVVSESTGTNGSAWGVTQDNDGKQWFQGGASGMPGYFQTPVAYGNFAAPDQVEAELNIPWGAPIRLADMQGGMGSVRMPDGTLSRATAGAGNDIVRAHRMPADLQGEYLYGEVVARIVRRIHPVVTEGVTQLRNAYKYNEFVKSTDPLFRPVDMTTAPDGTIYITDLYHGIIQEAQWTPRGSYLRARIEQHGLDKMINFGRIWRLSYEATPRDTTVPRMNTQTAAQLVENLNHPNGWWRDTAQQLLILKQDKTVAPALQTMARTSTNVLARFHALWTLEGLGSLDARLARDLMKDSNPRIRVQALRASETLHKAGDKSLTADYATLAKDQSAEVAMQALLTLKGVKAAETATIARSIQETNKARGVQLIATALLTPAATPASVANLNAADRASYDRGQAIYAELCFACHGTDGRGTPKPDGASGATMAPALAGSPRVNGHRDYVVNVVLHGMNGPIPGTPFNEIMVPMKEQNDQWIADVTSYIRNAFGNTASMIAPADVARARAEGGNRQPWTFAQLDATLPKILPSVGWKTTASQNSATASNATSFGGWNSGAPQAGGIWYQIELPETATVAEIQFTSGGAGGGRGGGGARGGARGGAPAQVVPAVAPDTDDAPAVIPAAAAQTPAAPATPRTFRVEVSTNGTTWTSVAEVQGRDGLNTIDFSRNIPGRFVRITQVEGAQAAFSMTNLRLLGTAAR